MRNCSIGSPDGEFGDFSTLSTKQAKEHKNLLMKKHKHNKGKTSHHFQKKRQIQKLQENWSSKGCQVNQTEAAAFVNDQVRKHSQMVFKGIVHFFFIFGQISYFE